MSTYGEGTYGEGVFGGGDGGSSSGPAWIPTDLQNLNATRWFDGDSSTSPSTTTVYSNTLTIPAGSVVSTLFDFPVRVNLAFLTAGWKAGLLDRGIETIRVKDQAGTELPIDVVWSNVSNGSGDLYFKAPVIRRLAPTNFTVELVLGATSPGVSDPIGRNSVWSDYDIVLMDGDPTNRVGSGSDLVNYTALGTVPNWFNFVGTSAPYVVSPDRTNWTIGGTYRTDSTPQAGIVSYSSSGIYSTVNREGFVLGSGTTPGIWNSTDAWLYEGAPTYTNGSTERFNFQQDMSTTSRKVHRNGVVAAQSLTSDRPSGFGDRFFVGASDLNVSTPVEPFTGAINRVYLRNGILSDSWIYSEKISWEDPRGFYSISEAPPAPPITVTHVWWDGATYQPAVLQGWWDGAALQPVSLVGAWDGASTQPVVPAS